VVLPEPRKPVRMVAGMRPWDMAEFREEGVREGTSGTRCGHAAAAQGSGILSFPR
jgi:hypothetical protein